MKQIQTQIQVLQQQQQALQTEQFAEQTRLSTENRQTSSLSGLATIPVGSHAQLPSLTSSWPVSGIGVSAPPPPLDKKIMDQIQRGENVNFNLILSATSFEISLTEDNEDKAPFSID